jgi:hypothetical protein
LAVLHVPCLSSQYERFTFGISSPARTWLAMPHGSWSISARRQDGVVSYGNYLAVFHTIFRTFKTKTQEGTPEGTPTPRQISKAREPSAKASLWSPPSLPPVGRKADLYRAKSSSEWLALMLGGAVMDRLGMVPPSGCSAR